MKLPWARLLAAVRAGLDAWKAGGKLSIPDAEREVARHRGTTYVEPPLPPDAPHIDRDGV